MKTTYIVVEVKHDKDLPHLADMVAGRTYTIDGVRDAEAWTQSSSMTRASVLELERAGFTAAEISLGSHEVVR